MKTATAPGAAVTYYRDANFLVTSTKVKSPRKTYRVDKIEKVSIRRDPYFIAVAFAAMLFLFLLRFGFVFPEPWAFFIFYLALVAAYVAKQFSMLFITSKAVSELAFIGLNDRLEKVREGIERAMHKEDNDDGLAGDHGEDSDEDDD